MDEARWARYAALGGIWFVVLNVIGAFLPGAPPKTTDSALKIAKYYHDHHRAIEIGTLLMGLGLIGLFWWFGSLWRLMVDAEGGSARMGVVALIGLGVAAAFALMAGVVNSTIALQLAALGGGGVKFFYIMTLVLLSTAGFGLVTHLAAVTSLSYRTRLFAPWVNVIGWIAALLFLVSTIGVVTDRNWIGVIGLVSFLVWCVWIVVVSVKLWQRVPGETDRHEARRVTGLAAPQTTLDNT